jgi:hypothetical protein
MESCAFWSPVFSGVLESALWLWWRTDVVVILWAGDTFGTADSSSIPLGLLWVALLIFHMQKRVLTLPSSFLGVTWLVPNLLLFLLSFSALSYLLSGFDWKILKFSSSAYAKKRINEPSMWDMHKKEKLVLNNLGNAWFLVWCHTMWWHIQSMPRTTRHTAVSKTVHLCQIPNTSKLFDLEPLSE